MRGRTVIRECEMESKEINEMDEEGSTRWYKFKINGTRMVRSIKMKLKRKGFKVSQPQLILSASPRCSLSMSHQILTL
jgi:hypothetical protein